MSFTPIPWRETGRVCWPWVCWMELDILQMSGKGVRERSGTGGRSPQGALAACPRDSRLLGRRDVSGGVEPTSEKSGQRLLSTSSCQTRIDVGQEGRPDRGSTHLRRSWKPAWGPRAGPVSPACVWFMIMYFPEGCTGFCP